MPWWVRLGNRIFHNPNYEHERDNEPCRDDHRRDDWRNG